MSDQPVFVIKIGTGEDCDIRVSDEYASRDHCLVFRYANGDVFVGDLGSTNGTRIMRSGVTTNVRGTAPLAVGDTLIVGRTHIPWTDPEPFRTTAEVDRS